MRIQNGLLRTPKWFTANSDGLLRTASDVANVLFHARNLKEREKFKHVYLGPDRTKQDQLAHNRLVKEMKLMIEKDSSKHYYIRNKKIYTVDKDLSARPPSS